MRTAFPWKEFLRKVAVIAIPVALQNLLPTYVHERQSFLQSCRFLSLAFLYLQFDLMHY